MSKMQTRSRSSTCRYAVRTRRLANMNDGSVDVIDCIRLIYQTQPHTVGYYTCEDCRLWKPKPGELDY